MLYLSFIMYIPDSLGIFNNFIFVIWLYFYSFYDDTKFKASWI